MPSRSPQTAPEDALMDSLVQVSFAVTAMLSQLSAQHDLSLTQLRVLAILRDRRPTMAQLADHLGLDRSTVSGLVDRASARGLVQRVANPEDRRSSRAALTDQGHRLADRVAAESRAAVGHLLSGLTPREGRDLGVLLTRALDAGGVGGSRAGLDS